MTVRWVVILVLVLLAGRAKAVGPPLENRLDETRYIEGLIEADLPEVLGHYLQGHPPRTEERRRWHRYANAVVTRENATDRLTRRAAAEAVVDARAAIVAAAPDDPRRARWLVDQAADLYFGLLADETVTALVGIPTPDQRRQAIAHARDLRAAVALADSAVADRLHTLGADSSRTAAAERRHLNEVEQMRRLPFLAAVARLVLVSLISGDEDDVHEIATRLEDVGPRLEGWLQARARLYAGVAWAHLGRPAEALLAFRDAEEAEAAEPAVGLAARLARLAETGPDSVEPLAVRAAGRAYERLLVADVLARLHARGGRSADRRAACEVYLSLAHAELGLASAERDAIVWDKLAGLGALWPRGDWPAVVEAADARATLRQTPTAALETLARLAEAEDIPASMRPAIWWAWGRGLADVGRTEEAVETWRELARRYPRSPEASRSLRAAAAVAQTRREPAWRVRQREVLAELIALDGAALDIDRYRVAAASLAYEAGDDAGVISVLDGVDPVGPHGLNAMTFRVLTLRGAAVRATPLTHDEAWRRVRDATQSPRSGAAAGAAQARASLRLYEAEAALELDEPAETLEILAQLPASASSPAHEAHALRLRVEALRRLRRLDEATAALDDLFERAPDVAAPVLQSMLMAGLERATAGDLDETRLPAPTLALAERLAAWLLDADDGDAYRPALLRTVADAFRLAQRPGEAIVLYDELLVDEPAAAPLLFGRAECLYQLGPARAAEAIGLYRRLAAAGTDLDPDTYWTSQLRIVQILDRAQRNLHQIVPRIRRLRQEDPELGGPRYQRGFLRLEDTHG